MLIAKEYWNFILGSKKNKFQHHLRQCFLFLTSKRKLIPSRKADWDSNKKALSYAYYNTVLRVCNIFFGPQKTWSLLVLNFTYKNTSLHINMDWGHGAALCHSVNLHHWFIFFWIPDFLWTEYTSLLLSTMISKSTMIAEVSNPCPRLFSQFFKMSTF